MKLYKVTLRGLWSTSAGISYAVANSCDEAYNKIKKYVNDKDWGNDTERELYQIELIAEQSDDPLCKTHLFL